MAGLDFRQNQVQTQIQTLSQIQIQSLEILSMGKDDLRKSIYSEVENNPALVITKDKTGEITTVKNYRTGPIDYTRLSSSSSASAVQASDNFQSALEAHPDERESLKAHLLTQLHVMDLTDEENSLGEKLIYNLNDKGFHTLSPVSLLDKNDKRQNEVLLKKMIGIIQKMDPAGVCTSGTEESLFVQSQLKDDVPPLATFILDKHLSFLDPPQPSKIIAKIKSWQKKTKEMFGLSEKELYYTTLTADEESVEKAVSFIKKLDPFPARDFGTEGTNFIEPDVYIEKLPISIEKDDFSKGLVKDGDITWRIKLSMDNLPDIDINPDYEKLKDEKSISENTKQTLTEGIKKAESFIFIINQRKKTLLEACCHLVKIQKRFFEKGPGNLAPLRQTDLAEKMNLHETTISRLSSSKYIQCEWGLFSIKYFFTSAIKTNEKSASTESVSRDNVLHEIKAILEEHKDDKKKLSDQKISDILKEKGIDVARRTVAKYRTQLNIESSYAR